MSTHATRIIAIGEVRPHGNADKLEIVPVGGWQAVIKKGSFKPGDKALYIEPDYVVPVTHPDFAFLAKKDLGGLAKPGHRLRAIRLRGELSYGLLIPVPEPFKEGAVGDDLMEGLGITRYEPPVLNINGEVLPEAEWPKVYASRFDIESLQGFLGLFVPGEPVLVTEKIHGANMRFVFSGNDFYVGSRSQWLKPDQPHIWNRSVTPEMRVWARANRDTVLYGECYGSKVQSLTYGLENRAVRFAAFAALKEGAWVDQLELFRTLAHIGVEHAPVLHQGSYDLDGIKALAETDSHVSGAPSGHMKEGVVIVPLKERRDTNIGRVALKHISNRYWESNHG